VGNMHIHINACIYVCILCIDKYISKHFVSRKTTLDGCIHVHHTVRYHVLFSCFIFLGERSYSTRYYSQCKFCRFIYILITIGAVLFIISCFGYVGTASRSPCCLISVSSQVTSALNSFPSLFVHIFFAYFILR